jgi:mannose-6-phosphate isomerase
MLREFLTFQPIYQERVWGGRALASTFGRTLPPGPPIGESWEIVDRPEAQSEVAGGPLAGQTLRSVMSAHAEELMGPGWPPERPFPILVKWLDCRERLSLQVHPPAALAAELGGEPKTENWYIADSAQGAQLIVGLRRGATRAQFEQAIADGTLEQCVHRFPVAVGDSILVRSGEVHAIDGGSLILEIQQNSDTTYRVYDWGRVGLDGKPRTLHLSHSLRSIDWEAYEPAPVRAAPTSGVIADCEEFRIRRVVLDPGEKLELRAGEQPRLLSVVRGRVGAGRGGERVVLERGANILVPYTAGVSVVADGAAIVLVTEDFA